VVRRKMLRKEHLVFPHGLVTKVILRFAEI